MQNMTASAAGTVEAPGRNVRQKAGLNRSILDVAPSQIRQMLAYKAERLKMNCELVGLMMIACNLPGLGSG